MVFKTIFRTSILKTLLVLVTLSVFSLSISAGTQSFTTLSGESVSYSELTSSPKTILFVWATWCPYCRTEIDELVKARPNLDGIKIYFVNTGEPKSKVKKFINSKKNYSGIDSQVILDEDSYIAQKFSVAGIPTYLFLKDSDLAKRSFFYNDDIVKQAFGSN
tara:strand:- start:425 stop:910 length:486 start_codon:yes stop_codon:yes gene_type:complete